MIIFPAKKRKRSAQTAQKERYMKFDCIASTNTGIDFGVKAGNKKIVFIKAGLGGNLFGYDDKYLKIAHRLNERYGCSIISASNPHDGKLHVASDKAIIEAYVKEKGIESPELYFFGHSNGGIKGLQLATELTFRKMLLVNMPLMIDFHKTKKYLSIIPDTKITFVYGELDPSYSYIPFFEGKFDNLDILKFPGADHNFAGLTDRFISLPDCLME